MYVSFTPYIFLTTAVFYFFADAAGTNEMIIVIKTAAEDMVEKDGFMSIKIEEIW